jgi:peroxiredoxin
MHEKDLRSLDMPAFPHYNRRVSQIKLRITSLIILIFGAAWVYYSAVDPEETRAWRATAPAAGFQAPDFELQNDLGELVRLNNLEGQAIILNFWASWCLPCREEMPAMEEIYQQYRQQGLTVLAVNATHIDSRVKALEFAALHGLNFPILFDFDGKVNQLYRVNALPTTFFISPTGTIQEVVIGGPMSEVLLRLRAENLLSGGDE